MRLSLRFSQTFFRDILFGVWYNMDARSLLRVCFSLRCARSSEAYTKGLATEKPFTLFFGDEYPSIVGSNPTVCRSARTSGLVIAFQANEKA